MGYESRLYVINKSDVGYSDSGKKWAEIVAEFNLCCVNNIDFSKYPETGHYIYIGDNEGETVKDKYGDALKELTLDEAVREIEKAMNEGEHYRRFKPCLALLREFRDTNKEEWGNDLAVLHYGY